MVNMHESLPACTSLRMVHVDNHAHLHARRREVGPRARMCVHERVRAQLCARMPLRACELARRVRKCVLVGAHTFFLWCLHIHARIYVYVPGCARTHSVDGPATSQFHGSAGFWAPSNKPVPQCPSSHERLCLELAARMGRGTAARIGTGTPATLELGSAMAMATTRWLGRPVTVIRRSAGGQQQLATAAWPLAKRQQLATAVAKRRSDPEEGLQISGAGADAVSLWQGHAPPTASWRAFDAAVACRHDRVVRTPSARTRASGATGGNFPVAAAGG